LCSSRGGQTAVHGHAHQFGCALPHLRRLPRVRQPRVWLDPDGSGSAYSRGTQEPIFLLAARRSAQGAGVAGSPATVVTADGGHYPASWPEVVAGELPFAHEQFRPTPDRPLGYRGCMNGWFPGATPPLRFSDGTPAEVEMDIEEAYGTVVRRKILTASDGRARNIRFKTPLPGWSLAQPLPVLGKDGRLRVFVKCHPWWVVCVDGKTGDILWKDPLSPFHARGMPADKADQASEVLTMVWACGTAIPPFFGGNNGGIGSKARCPTRAEAPELYGKVEKTLTAMQERMAVLDPKLALLIAPLVEVVRTDQVKEGWNAAYGALDKASISAYDVHTKVWFHGYTGLEMPTATSDGECVYVTFGQGQVRWGAIAWMERGAGRVRCGPRSRGPRCTLPVPRSSVDGCSSTRGPGRPPGWWRWMQEPARTFGGSRPMPTRRATTPWFVRRAWRSPTAERLMP
jgi:hypothetical protein